MRTIPVSDDSPPVRGVVARILESAGYKVVLANDGLQGIAAFHKERPDLVVTDIVMPEEEGIATIRRTLSDRPGTKIIDISGGGRVGNIDFLKLARNMGASEALPKPFDRDSLLAIVSAHLKDG